MKQQREILKKEKETADKIAARAFAQSYLADLVPSVFSTLRNNGYFFDPVERGKFLYLVHFLTRHYGHERVDLGPQIVFGMVLVS